MSVVMCPESGINNFSYIFLYNFDTSLIITLTSLKTSTHVANTHMQGLLSQNVDIGFS